MNEADPKTGVEEWRVKDGPTVHVEHPEKGGFAVVSVQAGQWACTLLNELEAQARDLAAAKMRLEELERHERLLSVIVAGLDEAQVDSLLDDAFDGVQRLIERRDYNDLQDKLAVAKGIIEAAKEVLEVIATYGPLTIVAEGYNKGVSEVAAEALAQIARWQDEHGKEPSNGA